MLKIEKKIIDLAEKNKNILFFAIVTVISVLIRFLGKDFLSADMSIYLLPWYEEISAKGGIAALGEQVGDYNLLYQTIISLLTYINIKPIYLYKIVSVVFDYGLALATAYGLSRLQNKGFEFFNTVYTVVLFLPTVVLNSAYWGQCDASYTLMIVLFLFDLYNEKYFRGFIWFGLAFAFKFQTIFIIPFVICYYIYKKKFTAFYALLSIVVFWLSGIVAFILGRDLLSPFKIYFLQAGEYKRMWANITSFWRLIGDNFNAFGKFSILLTLVICGIGIYAVLVLKRKIDTPEQFFSIAVWFVWACVFFLPAMHERYTFLLDTLLIILCFISAKYIKYACLSIMLSFATYGNFFSLIGEPNIIFVFVFFFAFAYYTYEILFKAEKTSSH